MRHPTNKEAWDELNRFAQQDIQSSGPMGGPIRSVAVKVWFFARSEEYLNWYMTVLSWVSDLNINPATDASFTGEITREAIDEWAQSTITEALSDVDKLLWADAAEKTRLTIEKMDPYRMWKIVQVVKKAAMKELEPELCLLAETGRQPREAVGEQAHRAFDLEMRYWVSRLKDTVDQELGWAAGWDR